jgi:hypothetical protein
MFAASKAVDLVVSGIAVRKFQILATVRFLARVSALLEGVSRGLASPGDEALPAKPVCEVPIAAIAAALGALCGGLTVAVPLWRARVS